MPTVSVFQDEIAERLGDQYADPKSFDQLCFEFGIELDEVTSEKEMAENMMGADAAAGLSDRTIFKIDVPANRYDLLCLEGLARSLRIFLGAEQPPAYRAITPEKGALSMTVKAATKRIRPYVVCAVLRNVTFTEARYKSFIDLQDKLHQNICRKRSLVAIGTHDLDTVSGPFTYEARAPQDISFVPLTQTREFRADELMEFYETDPSVKHIKPYVPLIKESEVYPCIYDSNGVLLSLPPIINGHHSRITLDTKNVLIECTATDLAKANIVLNMMVTMFSEYCAEPFTAETVNVVYEDEAVSGPYATPNLTPTVMTASVGDINSLIGIEIDAETAAELASKMQLEGRVATAADAVEPAAEAGGVGGAKEGPVIICQVPPTRADVLHACDVIEDVGIAYGYNKIERRLPQTVSIARQLPVNHLTDLIRSEMAMAGFTECLTMVLCSMERNYTDLNREADGKVVEIANPKTADFQVVRTQLMSGLLECIGNNGSSSFKDGVRLFEVSDVCEKDATADVGARNVRKGAVCYAGPTAGFEIVHGAIERMLHALECPRAGLTAPEAARAAGGDDEPVDNGAIDKVYGADEFGKHGTRFFIEHLEGDGLYFPGRAAQVLLERKSAPGVKEPIGVFGIVHPEVLKRFDIKVPVSVGEVRLDVFV